MNQNDLNERLVSHEVYVCLTPMVEFILKSASDDKDNWEPPFTWDDIENSYSKECTHCGKDESEHNNYCCADGESFEAEPQEIFEWWAVSPWLYEQLKEEGKPVIDTFPHLWGRTTSGQQIRLDAVITTIQKKTEYGGKVEK